ncbi:hypothetical protein B0H13DRAFT_2237905 [Mycena leptocephala]|nr:hypothetical protein B0H13DRAFT_2237905 [Mycena leptocephala]
MDGNGDVPTTAQIWRSIRHKDFSRNIRNFLWKVIHEGYILGDQWKHFNGFEDRGTCKKCDVPESMEHILTQCDEVCQEFVWSLVYDLWKQKTGVGLAKPLVGDIMACGLIKKGNTPGKTDAGITRLYKIRLRNERVINGKNPPTRTEIRNRWEHCLNIRISVDCLLTNKSKYGTKAVKKSLVLKTWNKILQNEDRLPADWTREDGVLVGIG